MNPQLHFNHRLLRFKQIQQKMSHHIGVSSSITPNPRLPKASKPPSPQSKCNAKSTIWINTLNISKLRIIALETQNQQLLQKTASLESELKKCIVDTESTCAVGLMDNILIGYCRNLPILAHKDSDLNQLWTTFQTSAASHGHGFFLDCELIFESLKHLHLCTIKTPIYRRIMSAKVGSLCAL